MRIKRLHLKNGYKRFHDLTIDLGDEPKRIIALVGHNGCGKSSVLDAMLFRTHHSTGSFTIGNTRENNGYEYHSMNKLPNYEAATNIEIIFDDNSTYQTKREQKRKLGKERTIFSFRSPYRYNNTLKISSTHAVSHIRQNNYGATNASNLDSKMEENYRRLYIKYNNYLNSVDCRPSEAKEKIIGDLNACITNCLDLEISSIGSVESNQGTLYFKKKDHPTEFDFNVLSSGEKEVVDILLDLYLRKEEYDNTIFLIDEPELHINTSIQRKLLLEINKLIGENCQIWITTHSIGFLRAIQDELKNDCQVIYFDKDINYASEVRQLTPVKMTSVIWRKLFEVALDDLATLVCPQMIIYCEGKAKVGKNGEELGLDAQVFNTIFGEKYPHVQFVSSGGNTEPDQRSEIAIAILSKVFPSVEILVFKDRDISSGRITSENDRRIYLENNPINHRVMKRWEIENYLYDKSVLKKYCSDNLLNFNDDAYNAFVEDINDQNLKDETGKIKNFCNIQTNINPERFKLSLAKYITEDMELYKELEKCIFERG